MSGWKIPERIVRASLACAFVTLVLALSSCARREAASATTAGATLRVSQRNEPATLDPQLATLPDEFFVIRALSEGLVTPNPAGGIPLPAVASDWKGSNDGRTWTFHLRPEATWSNGDKLTAADFLYSIERVLTAETAAPKASLFFVLEGAEDFYREKKSSFSAVGVKAPNAHTLVFTLVRPTLDFPVLVASGPWIPVHRATVETYGRTWARAGQFIGNGRFTLKSWAPDQRLRVAKNPRHWDATATKLGGIDFLAFSNGETEERAFRTGQVDVTMAVPFSKLDGYRKNEPALLHTVPLYETRYLVLNVTRPPLNDVRVRRALSLALHRRALVEKVLKSGQQPAFTFIPPGLGGHRSGPPLREDVAEARRLLAEAGFPEGKGFPKLELSTWPVATVQLEAIQQSWREELGISIGLAQREARAHIAALNQGDFDLGFYTVIPDYDSAADVLRHFTRNDAGNQSRWHDADFDRLVATGGAALTEAESRLLEALPAIPLYFNTKNFLLRPEVRGWQEDALWTRYYDHVSLEK